MSSDRTSFVVTSCVFAMRPCLSWTSAAGSNMPIAGIDYVMQPLFRDVTDHVRRVQEEIEALREVLAFAFEASLMTGQAQQTEISRKLAAWAAILAVPTAVAVYMA